MRYVSPHEIIVVLELQNMSFFLRSHYSLKLLKSLSHFYANLHSIPVLTAAVPFKSQANPAHTHYCALFSLPYPRQVFEADSSCQISPLPICIHFSYHPWLLNFGCCHCVIYNPINCAHKQMQSMYHTCHICKAINLCHKELTRTHFLVTNTY
jgi:hypothetical protein